jgi:hypothetical protein
MESHHLYPVLFYFRFREPYYSVSRLTLLSLDAASLMRSSLDGERYRWLDESAALEQLWRASTSLLRTLVRIFLPKRAKAERTPPDPALLEAWRARYRRAQQRLRSAGIGLRPDEHTGAAEYLALRADWDHDVRTLAPWMAYSMDEVDLAMAAVTVDSER